MIRLRRAGAGTDSGGGRVVWSVAEGGRGRRWREVRTSPSGAVRSSLLLETDPDGRFLHTEISTAAGLLTLHPEPDGTLHGNVVDRAGVHHVAGLPWARDGVVLLEGSPISLAGAATLLAAAIEPGAVVARAGVVVGLDLALRREGFRVERIGAATWRLDDGGHVDLDDRGLPRLGGGADWPLEVE